MPSHSEGSIAVSAPLAPPDVAPIIVSPKSVGWCNDVSLSALSSTGSMGRSWARVRWYLHAKECQPGMNATSAGVENALLHASRLKYTKLTISRSLLAGGCVYHFKIELQNFLGVTANSTSVLVRKENAPVPALLLDTYEITTKRLAQIRVKAKVQPPTCAEAAAYFEDPRAIRLHWDETSGEIQIPKQRDPRLLKLGPGLLTANRTYIFVSTVVMLADATINSSAFVTVSGSLRRSLWSSKVDLVL